MLTPRPRSSGARSRCSGLPWLSRPKRPFLEALASPVGGEANDPEVSILARSRLLIADGGPGDDEVVLDRHDLGVDLEPLVGSLPFRLPTLSDRVEADE